MTTKSALPGGARAKTASGRIQAIKPHEVLIFFVLAVLLALCIVVAQVVVQHAAPDAGPARRRPGAAGLNAAFEWGI